MRSATAAAAAGATLGALSGVVARVRRTKPLHPVGVVLTGRLRRFGASSGAAWVDAAGDDPVLVRISRGGGLPTWLPDVYGLALRVPDGDRLADVLLSTTGSAPGLRHLLVPHIDIAAGTYTSLLPYRGPHGPLLLGARAVRRTPVGAGPADVAQALRREPLHLRLAWATPTGAWQVFARLELDAAAEERPDPPVHFDPLASPTGLSTYPWAAALRAAAYARARAVVGPEGAHAMHASDHDPAAQRSAGTNVSQEGTTMSERPDGEREAGPDGAAGGAAGGTAGSAAAKSGAPAPDDPSKPESPPDLTRASWRYVFRKTIREFLHDDVTDLSASLTFWAVLAVAPAVLALVSVLGLFGDPERIVDRVMETVTRMAPGLDLQTIEDLVEDLAEQESAGLALLAGLLVALWSASGYVNAFARAMNRIYEVDEGRPIWKLRPMMLLVTFIALVLIAIICAAMVLSGPVAEGIGEVVGLSEATVLVWSIAKWPVIVVLVALTIAILYYATPNVRQPKFRWISIGSFVAIVVWALATLGFGLYVGNWGNYSATYGTLAGVIVFLLWVWLTNNALLFGAELDAELERARQLQAGIEAEESIQLPPRDTKASAKREKQVASDIETGRTLRLSRGSRLHPKRRRERG